jgi:alpha-N-arabinofuranosidase
MAQLVNVIAPIMTENGGAAWAQTIYYPFMHASKYGRGKALNALVTSPLYDCTDFTDVPYIDAAAVLCDDRSISLFCVNRDMKEDCCLEIDLRAFGSFQSLNTSLCIMMSESRQFSGEPQQCSANQGTRRHIG